MRKGTTFRVYPLLIMVVFFVFASSCEKDDDNNPASDNPTNDKTTAVFNSSVTYGTMTDQDGNVYKTVTIGKQTWMAENLRTTKYNDGTSIPNVTGIDDWKNLTTGAYCSCDNETNLDSIATYGYLYNWHAVNTRKLAPKGWHVPTDEEWTELTDCLGGTSVAGGKLKEIGTTHWNSPNSGATNESGFTALPGGDRAHTGLFDDIGSYGGWWSATEHHTNYAWYRCMNYDSRNVIRYSFIKECGYSVRCVKD